MGWLAGHVLLQAQPTLSLGQPARQAADWYGRHELVKTTFAARRQCDPAVQRSAVGHVADAMTTFVPASCPQRASAQLFVIGDSHATAYLPMLEQISAEEGRTVTVVQVPGCAYIDLMAPLSTATDAHCHRMAQATMRAVLAQARPHDVVFLPSLRLPRLIELGGSPRAMEGPDAYTRSAMDVERTRQAATDAPTWFAPFLDAGLTVVFELPKPVFRAHAFQCVDWFNRHNPDCRGGLTERRDDQERYRAPVVAALGALAATYKGVHTWDPLAALCDATTCSALRNGRPLFFDGDHVSPYGNLELLPSFQALLAHLSERGGHATP